MVYIMEIYVDGGCRGNGKPGAIGAESAVFKGGYGGHRTWIKHLPKTPRPTNQSAEIEAIILALEQALVKYGQLRSNPYLVVKIYSDSKYVIGCMTEWIYKWSTNGWLNASGKPVANQDLIAKAIELHDELRDEGSVEYIKIPRSENEEADGYCKQAMDKQE